MKQDRWEGRKLLYVYIFIYRIRRSSSFGSCHSEETAQTWTGANRYQKEPTAVSGNQAGPLPSLMDGCLRHG